MRSVTENILINENPAIIWDILLKSHEYENWNPIYNYVEGHISFGETITVEVQMKLEDIERYADEASAMVFQSKGMPGPQKWTYKVEQLIENELMEWKMIKLGGFLLEARHVCRLGRIEDKKTMFEVTMSTGGLIGNMMPGKVFYSYNKAMILAFINSFKWYVEEGRAKNLTL